MHGSQNSVGARLQRQMNVLVSLGKREIASISRRENRRGEAK